LLLKLIPLKIKGINFLYCNMKKELIIVCCLLAGFCYSQEVQKTQKEIEQAQVLTFLADLSEKGMEYASDSIKTGKEFKHVLEDAKYRDLIYPKTYTWESALYLLKSNNLKQAFWYFINLYPNQEIKRKELIVKSLLAYEEYLKMDEVLINTFYTYAMVDPEISIIANGKPEIVHPDVLERKLGSVKEIVGFIKNFRLKNNAAVEKKKKSNP
jgi:hypothetical protein